MSFHVVECDARACKFIYFAKDIIAKNNADFEVVYP